MAENIPNSKFSTLTEAQAACLEEETCTGITFSDHLYQLRTGKILNYDGNLARIGKSWLKKSKLGDIYDIYMNKLI